MELAQAAGITASEWIRTVLAMAADSPTLGASFTAEDQGYAAGRKLGLAVAHARIQEAMSNLPTSFEEAVAQHGDDS